MTYESRSEALTDARLIQRSRKHFNKRNGCRKANSTLRPYECSICGKFHLTTRSKLKYE